MTYYVLSNVPTGHTYFINVFNENVVGEGDNNTTYVLLLLLLLLLLYGKLILNNDTNFDYSHN